MENSTQRYIFSLLLLVVITIILVYGKSVLIPFILAVMVWYLIKAVKKLIQKIPLGKYQWKTWVINILSSVIIFAALGVIGKILVSTANNFMAVMPQYIENVTKVSNVLNQKYGLDIFTWIDNFSSHLEFSKIIKELINSMTEIFSNAFLVIIYVVFLMLEESSFPNKLSAIFLDKEALGKNKILYDRINHSIFKYISVKTSISLLTGVLSYIGLIGIGIDFAFFWAFLIFLLNFIPTIGSLIATLFPATIALFQFGEIAPFFIVLGVIGGIQMLVGNFIEPKVMGNSLNISSLVVLLSLAFWGSIWGVVGMLLCVPITVVMIILLAQFPGTRSIAILLSSDGNVDG